MRWPTRSPAWRRTPSCALAWGRPRASGSSSTSSSAGPPPGSAGRSRPRFPVERPGALWCNPRVAGTAGMDAAVEPIDAEPVGTAALELRGVVKSWGDQHVLREVDFTLEPGCVVAIAGRNGAGKTTLLRVASGLIVPERGTIRLEGLDPERDRTEFQRRLGYLSAGNSGLYARLKAEHHLDLATKLMLMPRRERKPAIERALQAFELEPLCGRRVDRLSMGQRQRLRLALSFVHRPSVVMLDEPSTSLDEEGRALVQQALNDLKARGGAAIVCVPTGGEPLPVVDRVVELSEGRLL